MQKPIQRRRSLHVGKTHDQHLEACCRFFFCKTGNNPKLPSSHRHYYQYLNGAKLRALETYIMMTADVGLPDVVSRHTQDRYVRIMNIGGNRISGRGRNLRGG